MKTYFLIASYALCLVLGLGSYASAEANVEQDSTVNVNIKEEYIRIDAAQKQSWEFNRIAVHPNNDLDSLPRQPVDFNNPLIEHQDNISSLEQSGDIDEDPRQGITHKYDPNNSIENKIADDQAYKLYRDHYRGAVKREFIRRAQAAGYNPSEREANDLTARALGQ